MNEPVTRRGFLAVVPALLSAPLLDRIRPPRGKHPEPRPGIDASEVIPDEDLVPYGEHVREVYDMVREMPQVADGIGCFCGCATRPGYRSLLTCYYADGMASGCAICQGEARLTYRRWKEGQSLDQIRRAIEARFA